VRGRVFASCTLTFVPTLTLGLASCLWCLPACSSIDSYKWAEILSCDAFGAFEEAAAEGPAAVQHVGRRFRETVLGLGGGQHPLEVFAAFRGREPSMEPLLRQYGLAK